MPNYLKARTHDVVFNCKHVIIRHKERPSASNHHAVDEELDKLIAKGILVLSDSPLVAVRKRDGTIRI